MVLKPKSTNEVSKILKFCNDRRLAICPQGGNTGLVGGSVPVYDEIVLNFSLMNKIISLDEISGKNYSPVELNFNLTYKSKCKIHSKLRIKRNAKRDECSSAFTTRLHVEQFYLHATRSTTRGSYYSNTYVLSLSSSYNMIFFI